MTTPDPVREAARERLKAFARQHAPGTCKILSMGDACICPLCDIDNLAALSAPPPQVPHWAVHAWIAYDALGHGIEPRLLTTPEDAERFRRRTYECQPSYRVVPVYTQIAASPPPNTPEQR